MLTALYVIKTTAPQHHAHAYGTRSLSIAICSFLQNTAEL